MSEKRQAGIGEQLKPVDINEIARQIWAVQRKTRQELGKVLDDGEVTATLQTALGADSLHAGPLGDGEGRGPCVYFVGTRRCADHNAGRCSPCGFSCVALPGMGEEEWLKSQMVDYRMMMDRWVTGIETASGEGVWVPQFERKGGPMGDRAVLVTGFIGSFFSGSEVSVEGREMILRGMIEDFQRRDLNPQVYFEARAEDVLRVAKDGELARLKPLFEELSARFILGLESRDELVRNGIYAKGLALEDFEQAVVRLQGEGFGVNAFIFFGNHSMGDGEMVADVKKTLAYLRERNVVPVLQTPSLTPGSFNHVLRSIGRRAESRGIPVVGDYRFVDPRSFLEVVREAVRLFPFDPEMDHYPVTFSLGGGPPVPIEGFWVDGQMSTCQKCSWQIRDALLALRTTWKIDAFEGAVSKIDRCECGQRYHDRLEEEREWPPLEERVRENVTLVEGAVEDYISAEIRTLAGGLSQE